MQEKGVNKTKTVSYLTNSFREYNIYGVINNSIY